MFRAITAAVRGLFSRSAGCCDLGWSNRFLPAEVQESRRDQCRFSPARDLCW